jgi:hypothetical protein
MTAKEFYNISEYPQSTDKYDILTKKFDQLDMIDFASKYLQKATLSDILKVKKQNKRKYINEIISLLKSIDFKEIIFEDWELILIRIEIDRLKQLSWLPKSIHFNSINDFQSL